MSAKKPLSLSRVEVRRRPARRPRGGHGPVLWPRSPGGASKAEVIVSNQAIDYPPLCTRVDLFLTLTQETADAYCWDVKPGAWVLVDADLVTHPPTSRALRLLFTIQKPPPHRGGGAAARRARQAQEAHGGQRGRPGGYRRSHTQGWCQNAAAWSGRWWSACPPTPRP